MKRIEIGKEMKLHVAAKFHQTTKFARKNEHLFNLASASFSFN